MLVGVARRRGDGALRFVIRGPWVQLIRAAASNLNSGSGTTSEDPSLSLTGERGGRVAQAHVPIAVAVSCSGLARREGESVGFAFRDLS